jgi:DNA-binding protein YbaB
MQDVVLGYPLLSRSPRTVASSSALHLNWWGSKSTDLPAEQDVDVDGYGKGSMGGVSGMVDSMENLKRAQRAGKMTRSLVDDLASTTVEGTAADGKVRVVLDCQQRPVTVNIDETYLEGVAVSDLCTSLTTAMNDAHSKSRDRMDEKMKTFYDELGLTG